MAAIVIGYYNSSMLARIDTNSPVPAFHQLAEAIRYRIAVGSLKPGERLPSLRSAAADLGVHYHTVRRAYASLETEGLLEIRRGGGTFVRPGGGFPSGSRSAGPLRDFLARTIGEARERHGLGAAELAELVRVYEPGTGMPTAPSSVSVIECNLPQARDYADQVSSALGMEVATWLLSEAGEPPPGMLIGTYFHFNEIRERWPRRTVDLWFVTVEPDSDLPRRLIERFGKGRRVVLCEPSEARAHHALPDLIGLLPPDLFRLEIRTDPPDELFRDRELADPLLFAPRIWAQLTPEQRADRRAIQLRYVIRSLDLSRLRDGLGGSETAPLSARPETGGPEERARPLTRKEKTT